MTCGESRLSLLPFELPSVARKKLSVGFDGGQLSSDAGVLVLRGVEKKLGLAARLASCIRDRRKPVCNKIRSKQTAFAHYEYSRS
jgi:hypothetical protein